MEQNTINILKIIKALHKSLFVTSDIQSLIFFTSYLRLIVIPTIQIKQYIIPNKDKITIVEKSVLFILNFEL